MPISADQWRASVWRVDAAMGWQSIAISTKRVKTSYKSLPMEVLIPSVVGIIVMLVSIKSCDTINSPMRQNHNNRAATDRKVKFQLYRLLVAFSVLCIIVMVGLVSALLLIRAGDVELNPGPGMDAVLNITKLREVYEKLKSASCHWFDIGLALDIDYNSLDNLRLKYHHDSDVCLREMLALRLQSGGPLSWRILCIALKSPTVGRSDLAAQLEEYNTNISITHQDVSPNHIEQRPSLYESTEVTTVEKSPDQNPVKEMQNVTTGISVDHPPGEIAATPMAQELEQDSIDMEMRFSGLVAGLFRSLNARNVAKDLLVAYLAGFSCLKKVYDDGDQCLFRAQKPKLRKCTTISEVWDIIGDYFSYFDYEIVEHITKHLGTQEDKSNMLEYKQKFLEYAKKRVVKMKIGESREDCSEMFVKLDSTYNGCEIGRLKRFERQLSIILKLNDGVLKLHIMHDGCIELRFLIPSFIVDNILPLTSDQEAALKKERVLLLHCGDYHYVLREEQKNSDHDAGEVDISTESGRKPHMKSKPNPESLLSELDSVVDWQLLIVKMGVEKNEIDTIKKNIPEDIDHQKKEAFGKWLAETPNACWKDVIYALFEIKESTLARSLTTKYPWKDPSVYITANFLSAANQCRLTAEQVIPHKKFLEPLDDGCQYYTFRAESAEPLIMTKRLAAVVVTNLNTKIMKSPHTLMERFKSVEESAWKSNYKAGLGARFGKMYWKFDNLKVLPPRSTKREWINSELFKRKPKANFHREVEGADMEQLFEGRKRLGNDVYTKLKLTFEVKGQDAGDYLAIISTYDSKEVFYLDCVYPKYEGNTTKISVGLPGRKYDFRIFDCLKCDLLEPENSIPYKIAKSISEKVCKLPERKLRIMLHGKTANGESTWKINFIRQEVQRQYEWKPDKKWILNRYDLDVFNSDKNQAVRIDQVPLNEPVDILHFNFSKQEVELWGHHIYQKDVNKTNPSREKYYYIEGIDGVQLPGGEVRPPCDWTAEELLSDFEVFLGDAFKIAHILDGSPY